MNTLSHPGLRVLGFILAAFCFYFFDPSNASVLHQLGIPLLFGVAAFLMTQAFMAVAIATLALAAIHTDLGATDWIQARAYPAIACLSLLICGYILMKRFKRHISETHAARWAARKTTSEPDHDDA